VSSSVRTQMLAPGMQFLFFSFIERSDGNLAADVNGHVHGVFATSE